MKPFDLELAKAGAKVQTRDGRDVKIIYSDAKNKEYPLVALIDNNGIESAHMFTTNGKYSNSEYIENPSDLFMAPEVHIKYTNFYKDSEDTVWNGKLYDTIEEAKNNIDYDNVEDSEYLNTLVIELTY